MRSNTQTRDNSMLNHTEIHYVDEVLANMTKFWERRAQVKKTDPICGLVFDAHKPDFLSELLPFHDHYLWQEAPTEIRSTVLSYAWVMYNWKTIYIETDIITPVCNDVLFNKLPGVSNMAMRSSIVQTLVDESYHTLMAMNACKIVLQERQLQELSMDGFNLIGHMESFKCKYKDRWKKQLIQYAVATVSETLISDYLKKISDSRHIQPICQITTEAHRKDELAHSSIFSQMLKCIYYHLDNKQKSFFLSVLPRAVEWFADRELNVWWNILEFIGFPDYQSMLADIESEHHVDVDIIDYTGVIELLHAIDVDIDHNNFFIK